MSTPVYLLDCMVVSYFLQAKQKDALGLIGDHVGIAIADAVHDELLADTHRGPEYAKWQRKAKVAIHALAVGGAGARVLAALEAQIGGRRDKGERKSIAIASEAPELVFVTHDVRATFLALRELGSGGERVVSFFEFVRRGQAAAGITRAAVEACASIALREPKHEPTWWRAWLNALPT